MALTDTYLNQDLFDQFNGALGAASAGGGVGDQYITNFMNAYKQMTGQDAGINEIQGFIKNAGLQSAALPGDLGYGDLNNLSNSYVQNTFGPQVQKYQQQQQTDSLNGVQKQIGDLVNQQTQNFTKQFSDPTSDVYKTFSGNMNNLGITPSSGAFQAGMGSTIAGAGSGFINQMLGGVTSPALNNIQGTSSAPYQQTMQNRYSGLGHLNELGDFGLQSDLAKFLQNQMQPSGFEKGLGYAKTASSILGNTAGPGMAIGSQMTSYVCKELIKRNLITESDMNDFHTHIMPAMFTKGRAFWKYACDGYAMVQAANQAGIDWKKFKPLLFDFVMAEKNPAKAVNLYAKACALICYSASVPELWDNRVLRTSIWDSIPFFPHLFTYKPFLEALLKCIRMKLAFVMDRPEVAHGAR
jgi:hypothetical protein